jgi:ComF family protein
MHQARHHEPTSFPRFSIFPHLGRSLATVLFPTACALCGEDLSRAFAARVCNACWAALAPWTGPVCSRCGLPLASDRALDSVAALCGDCRNGEFHFDRARSYGLYAGRLREVILQLKFHGGERLGPKLGVLLVEAWKSLEAETPVERPLVVPVPLHRSRERERGFNQAEFLARGFCRAFRSADPGRWADLVAHTLRRRRATRPQAGLSLRGRHENVRGVFEVVRPARVRDREVFLVDDVMTTGATVSACARELKRAGARQVVVLTAARATPQFPDIAPVREAHPVDDSGTEQT